MVHKNTIYILTNKMCIRDSYIYVQFLTITAIIFKIFTAVVTETMVVACLLYTSNFLLMIRSISRILPFSRRLRMAIEIPVFPARPVPVSYTHLVGCSIIILINIFLIPVFGYMACAWAGFAGYGVAMLLSYFCLLYTSTHLRSL